MATSKEKKIKPLINKPGLGIGIFTPPDISVILGIPQRRIRWYVNEIWDNRFGKSVFNERYSWDSHGQRAVNFLVLIEFKVVHSLLNLGISTRKILKARNAIAKQLHLPYPFATTKLLANSKEIWYSIEKDVVSADESNQLNFSTFVQAYCKNIDFGSTELAQRLWPKGKTRSIIVDPHHQFGQPSIVGTNITAETIYSMYRAGESKQVLCDLYDLPIKKINDAILFFRNAA